MAFAAEINTAENITAEEISREDLFVPEEVVVEITKFFIRDMASISDVDWGNETEIVMESVGTSQHWEDN